MPGITRSTFLDPAVDEAIESIAKARKWTLSQTIAELLRESPSLKVILINRGIDPETLEPVSSTRDSETAPAPSGCVGGHP